MKYQGTSIGDLHLTLIPARVFTSPELQRNVPCNDIRGGLREVYWRLKGDKVPGGGKWGQPSLSFLCEQSKSWQLSLSGAHLCPGSDYCSTGWERLFFFLVKRALRVNKFDKGVHTVEFKVSWVGWRVGWEGAVEQHKWSKPFRAAVSSKLSLIHDITWAKSSCCHYFLL